MIRLRIDQRLRYEPTKSGYESSKFAGHKSTEDESPLGTNRLDIDLLTMMS